MTVHFFVLTLNERTGGGSHFNAISYIRALRTHGHTVIVHTFVDHGNEPPADIELVQHQSKGFGILASRTYFASLLQQYEDEADIFFIYGAGFTFGAGLYRRQGKTPVAVYLDTYLPSMRLMHQSSRAMWWYQYKRLLWDKTIGLLDARRVDLFLACSPYVRDVYICFGFPKKHFAVLPNIVSLPQSVAPKTLKAETGPIHLLYVGRLIYDKGVDMLVEALAQIKDIQWILTIVGDGPEREKIQQFVRARNLPVEIHGWVAQEELGHFYQDADIFVHPARWPEPFGRTIVDALAYGLPVIVPKEGGAAWIAGSAGMTFKNHNLGDLTRCLRLLCSDFLERSNRAERAVERTHLFSQSTVSKELMRAIENISAVAN